MTLFIHDVLAAGTQTAGKSQDPFISTVLMLVLFFALIYFFLWRPQSKRAKEHQNLMASVKVGDEVLTSGGMLGKVAKIEETVVLLKLSEQVEVRFQKSSIANVLPKGTLKF